MDLDGLIKLNDAEIKTAESQAEIAGKWLANAKLFEEVVKARIENIKAFLNVQWDIAAEKHLQDARIAALQRKSAAEKKVAEARRKIQAAKILLVGGSWTAIQQGWLGFQYIQSHSPTDSLVKAGELPIGELVLERSNWIHPEHEVPQVDTSRGILDWARRHTCYPMIGGAAWKYLAEYYQVLSEGAEAAAAALDTKRLEAEKVAAEILAQETKRLDAPHNEGR